ARHGLLRRRLALVPHAKVQSVRLTQGPWLRAWRVADVHVDTGANKTVTARLRDADEAAGLLHTQADHSRTGRHRATPDRWMTKATSAATQQGHSETAQQSHSGTPERG
ncbi:PH domain-containing protein, partial [Streptomyces sp. SID5998]|nr:PH domain-containing protein [Streptomyces sp. SID5998]